MQLNKNKFVLLLVGTLLLLSLGFISSAGQTASSSNLTINLPTASDFMAGSFKVNITFDNAVYIRVNNYTNMSVFLSSAGLTANTTIIKVITNSLNSTNISFDNASIVTGPFEDGTDYTVTFEISNGTDKVNTSRTGITIDNGIPVAPSSLTPTDASIDTDGSVTFNGTVTNANTTSCTLQFEDILPPGGNNRAMTYSTTSCSLTISSIPDQTYKWFIRASDGTNTTDSSHKTVSVDLPSGTRGEELLLREKGAIGIGEKTSDAKSNAKYWIGAIVIALIIGLVIKYKK